MFRDVTYITVSREGGVRTVIKREPIPTVRRAFMATQRIGQRPNVHVPPKRSYDMIDMNWDETSDSFGVEAYNKEQEERRALDEAEMQELYDLLDLPKDLKPLPPLTN